VDFAGAIVDWQRREGRHGLPWQASRDPYRIWLSEIMLQQTQVATVLPYYLRFIESFPDVFSLASASPDEVMRHWAGLGYYSRARNLHRCARLVVSGHAGRFPVDPAQLERLPGIGRSTAAAIAVFASGARAAILDGNVKRVFCRFFGVEGWPGGKPVMDRLWQIAERELPDAGLEAYTQGLMDLGATVCKRSSPACAICPVASGCFALREQATTRLPSPRPARELPHRICRMLVIGHAGGWLVERRPPTGIWGGLWSLPQSDPQERLDDSEGQALVDIVAARHGLRVDGFAVLPTVRHAFTHFRLSIVPLLASGVVADGVASPDATWLAAADVPGAALPQPVKKLLRQLGPSGLR
jgi:A/G-specific adenine glycosylase